MSTPDIDTLWKRVDDDASSAPTLYLKWTEPGQELQGTWRGVTTGRYGALGNLETDDGQLVAFTLHTVLSNKLGDMPDGALVKIVYIGLARGKKSGKDYKAFDVYTAPKQ